MLLSRGANPNLKDFVRATPFWHTVMAGNMSIVGCLLGLGVDINVVALDENEDAEDPQARPHAYSPLYSASLHGQEEVTVYYRRLTTGWSRS